MNKLRWFPLLAVFALAPPVIAAPIVTDPGDPTPDPVDPYAACTEAFAVKQAALLDAGIQIGARVGNVQMHAGWCHQVYTAGRLYSGAPDGGSTVAVYGPVLAEYASVGYEVGFGRALSDPMTLAGGGVQSNFGGGIVVVHPTLGSHAVYTALSYLWVRNGAYTRFGYPITDQISNPGLGAYSWFEHGVVARTTDFGTWIDYTGNGEGRATATATLYQDGAFLGSSLSKTFSNESPVALRAQLGTLDEQTSSLAVAMPTRTSLYLFADSPLENRYVRISGADGATVKVSNIGAFMNDRTSSILFANHGTASARTTIASLQTQIQGALDALDTHTLIASAMAGHSGVSASMRWTSPVTVELLPGERLLQFSRRAYVDIDADCYGFTCNADGYVDFVIYVRPYVASDFQVHVAFVQGDAVSISCDGRGCDDRASALDNLFTLSTQVAVESAFNHSLDTSFAQLPVLANSCAGISVRRVNVLPTFIEVVVADTTAAATCAAGFTNQLDTSRPRGRVENSDGTVITSGVTVVSRFPTFPVMK